MVLNILVCLLAFAAMEFVAWFTHKYIMHGMLWFMHQDHHQNEPGFFEKNDGFFLLFAIPSAYCYMSGMMAGNDFRLFIGIGISLYGLCYFLVHDIIIHQRFKIATHWNNRYVLAIRRAHKIHHKHLGKHHGENFGMLVVPFKYWKNPTATKNNNQ